MKSHNEQADHVLHFEYSYGLLDFFITSNNKV